MNMTRDHDADDIEVTTTTCLTLDRFIDFVRSHFTKLEVMVHGSNT